MHWAQSLMPLAEALKVLLSLLRDAGAPRKVAATAGQFQQSLPANKVTTTCCACAWMDAGPDTRDLRPPADGKPSA